MRRVLLAAASAVLLATSAYAADVAPLQPLVTKDSTLRGFMPYPYNGGSGFYAGANTMGGVSQATATSTGTLAGSLATGSLTAAGGGVGGTVGYTSGNNTLWWALEGSGDWMNVTTGTTVGPASATVASRWSSEQIFKIGGSLAFTWLSAITNIGVNFPTFNLPAVPNGISVAASPHPYLYGGIKEFGIGGTVNQSGGTTVGVAPLVGVGTISSILNAAGQPTGLALDLFAEVVFADKGLSLNNVLGTSGTPVNANIQMTRQYWTGAKILF